MGDTHESSCFSSSHRPCPGSWSKVDRPLLPLTGSVQPLSSQSLRASSSTGTDPHHLFYWVVRGPQLGRLFHALTEEALVNFTQAEVRAQLSTATAQIDTVSGAHSAMDTLTDMGSSSIIVGSRHTLGPTWSRLHVLPSRSHQAGRANGV